MANENFALKFLNRLRQMSPDGQWVAPYLAGRGTTAQNLRAAHLLAREGAIEIDGRHRVRPKQ
jgi:hypothetical protein